MIHWFNTGLVWLSFGMIFNCLLRANVRQNPAQTLAVFLMTAGTFGIGLGMSRNEWEPWLNTFLYGGLAAFLLAARSPVLRFPWRWGGPAAIAVELLTFTIVWIYWLMA